MSNQITSLTKEQFEEAFSELWELIRETDAFDDVEFTNYYDELYKPLIVFGYNTKGEEDLDNWFLENYNTTVSQLESDGHIYYCYIEDYSTCNSCGLAIFVNDYGVKNFWMNDYGFVCPNCVRDRIEDYLEDLTNNPTKANTILSNEELEELGYELLNYEYEIGLHGIYQNPENALENLLEKGYKEVVFSIKSSHAFETNYVAYVKKGDE